MNEEIIEKTIDLDKIISAKMGEKSKYVPEFVINWLRKTIHEDEVNRFLWRSRGLKGTPWLEECVRYLDMTLNLVGVENLPKRTTSSSTPSSPTIRSAVPTVWLWAPSSAATTTGDSAIWSTTCS